MKKMSLYLALGGLLTLAASAYAGTTATQTVTYQVSAINEISVSGSPGALVISTATAGSAPNAVSDATTSYAVTTNQTNKRITASLNTDMPAGLTLTLAAAAPTGGTSSGTVALSTTPANVVTGISTLNETGKSLTYSLSATSAAGVVESATKTVTLTIADA